MVPYATGECTDGARWPGPGVEGAAATCVGRTYLVRPGSPGRVLSGGSFESPFLSGEVFQS